MRLKDNVKGLLLFLPSVSAVTSSSAALCPVGHRVTTRRNKPVKDHCSAKVKLLSLENLCGFFLAFPPPPGVFYKKDCLTLLKENKNKKALQSQKTVFNL